MQIKTSGHGRDCLIKKYNIHKLVMCNGDFNADAFEDTLVKVFDRLLHAYGSSRSGRLNVMLTDMGAWLIQHADIVNEGRKQWQVLARRDGIEADR